MKCKDTGRMIIGRLAGELSARRAAKLEKHLAACEVCRKEFEILNKVWQSGRETLEQDSFAKELTPDRRAEIFAIAMNEEKRRRRSLLLTRLVEYAALLFICCILAGMFLPALNQAREKSRRVTEQSIRKQKELESRIKEMDEKNAGKDVSVKKAEEADFFGDADEAVPSAAPAIRRKQFEKLQRVNAEKPSKGACAYSIAASGKAEQSRVISSLQSAVPRPATEPGTVREADNRVPILRMEQKSISGDVSATDSVSRLRRIAADKAEIPEKSNVQNIRCAERQILYSEGRIATSAPMALRVAKKEVKPDAEKRALVQKTFTLRLKLWNMTPAANARKYLTKNQCPLPAEIRILGRNTISIQATEADLKKIEKFFEKLQKEEKELGDFRNGLPFIKCALRPVSTFPIDTDTASYVQARKNIERGEHPEPLKIRPEEFINYFNYNYRSPQNATFAVYPEAAPSPFRPNNTLFRIGIQGKRLGPGAGIRTHYTILLDTSGSMAVKDRMELAKKALAMLLEKLRSSDYVSLLLCGDSTSPVLEGRILNENNRRELLAALAGVIPHGVADFAEGISTAYNFAGKHFLSGGANRIIIISDGIFELSAAGKGKITAQIEAARRRGISNIVIGLGGDGDDDTLEKVASLGDGSYVFLDSEREAEELFTAQFEARFREIARDVKIQVEFNKDAIESYRQIGYENRQLGEADFRNDKVDAGEVGSGQAVT
ncbi:MAG: von Willebrand factor type A domain-containing protein, partial [Victivallaceae bacterium]|nr:von Willebrand factor type A domain-containing protein [Victivallaceae bacterium]